MSDFVLRTKNVSKVYKNHKALDKVNLTVKKGDIYGFIGQNGAGKSTLLRLVTGLSFPTDGQIEIFGQNSNNHLNQAQKRIGAIIENPALFPEMTARQNLEVQRCQKGIPGKSCIDEALELVELKNTGKKKVKNFSLGMKQRLGLAMSILSDPEFLILDEPTNGLDPIGIVELRDLIKKLNVEKGLTVLISSHILSELYQLATRYGIIHNGQLIEELTLEELDMKCQQHLKIKVDNPKKAVVLIEENLINANYEVLSDGYIHLFNYLNEYKKVSKLLSDNDLIIEHFSQSGENLESYFSKLIGGETHV